MQTGSIETFEVINNDFAKDENNFFFKGEVLKNIDYDTFVVLKDGYSKDKNNVYFLSYHYYLNWNGIVKWADPKTFEILSDWLTKDKNNCYIYREKTNNSKCENIKIK